MQPSVVSRRPVPVFVGALFVVGLVAGAMARSGDPLTTAVAAADEEPKAIKPDEARRHVGQAVSVTMLVRHAKHSEKTKRTYLDSEKDYRDEKNLGILIEDADLEKFSKAGIEDPHAYYDGKTIRVTGKPFLEENLIFIRASAPEQITVLEKK
jgi:hypothetical protein